MYYLHYISDWKHADKNAMDILGKRIVEVWSKCIGLDLNKCCKSKDEGSIRRTLNYIVYKTIKISLTYAKYKRYQEDVKKLQSARVDNYDLYTLTWDKWMDQIENTYRKIFTDAQWSAYLKAGAGKQRKAREKRKAKMAAVKPSDPPKSK